MALSKPTVRSRTSNPRATFAGEYSSPSPTGSDSGSDGDAPEYTVTPLTSAELLNGDPLRELILLGGKDGVGKTCSIVSTAQYVEMTNPDAKFYIIDSENKFKAAMRSFGSDAPGNIVYYQVENMNQVTGVTRKILSECSPGDWLGIESMARIWEMAQDLGYTAVSGYSKVEYMEERRKVAAQGGKKPGPVPQPDDLWPIAKGAHDGAFLNLVCQRVNLNVIATTLMKPIRDGGFMKENPERKAFRAEMGLDANLAGATLLPGNFHTLALMEMKGGQVTCRLLRDDLSKLEDGRVEFPVENRKAWASVFFSECR